MYYTHPGYKTHIFGKKNPAYYIQIFTVIMVLLGQTNAKCPRG